jgi:hypothetical protein
MKHRSIEAHMQSLLVRSSALGALLLMPAFTTLAQDPRPQRPVEYSAEELDNLVAPVGAVRGRIVGAGARGGDIPRPDRARGKTR